MDRLFETFGWSFVWSLAWRALLGVLAAGFFWTTFGGWGVAAVVVVVAWVEWKTVEDYTRLLEKPPLEDPNAVSAALEDYEARR